MRAKFIFLILFSMAFWKTSGMPAEGNSKHPELIAKLKMRSQEKVAFTTSGQGGRNFIVLNQECNLPRLGDHLIKLEASYLQPGKGGSELVWDFNQLQLKGTEYELGYSLSSRSDLTGIDDSSMSMYFVSGDSLLSRGTEDPLMYIHLEKPEEIMIFPMAYGNKSTNYFYGKGKYCDRLELDVAGFTIHETDGSGMLILPENDTIPDVLRVHSVKITIMDSRPISPGFNITAPREAPLRYDDVLARLEQDTVAYTITDTYKWYKKGARYPVFETGTTQRMLNGKSLGIMENTYVFHPLDQQELAEDKDNLALQDKKPEVNSAPATGNDNLNVSGNFSIQTYPNPVVDVLQVEVQTKHQEQGQVFIYSLQGQVLLREEFSAQGGRSFQSVDMSRLAKGSYVLKVETGGMSEKKVIVKQ